ncbi:MAG: class I SAM-dependent methyltransferase [Acidobacteria bacterium]|nr:class I SAM-dependent methyltransferase [Acidobacteriota bacterium]
MVWVGVCFGQESTGQKLSPYYPTPEIVVEKMLQLGELKRGEKLVDIGSGDGRIVIAAVEKYGARAEGVELDEGLARQSTEKIRTMGLEKAARIIHGDALQQDYSSANVVTVYLLPSFNAKLKPLLEKQLKKGTRVVAHDFEIAGWTPLKTVLVEDDGEGVSHTVYLYVR